MRNKQQPEEWVTCLHESAHVVFAVLNGRRVKWVTIVPEKVTTLNGKKGISLGRWDVSDKQNPTGWEIEDWVKHVQVTIAGYLTEYMITGVKNGMDDEEAARRICDHAGLDFSSIENDTILLIGNRTDQINRLAYMLMENKTLDEDQIKRAIYEDR